MCCQSQSLLLSLKTTAASDASRIFSHVFNDQTNHTLATPKSSAIANSDCFAYCFQQLLLFPPSWLGIWAGGNCHTSLSLFTHTYTATTCSVHLIRINSLECTLETTEVVHVNCGFTLSVFILRIFWMVAVH